MLLWIVLLASAQTRSTLLCSYTRQPYQAIAISDGEGNAAAVK
jgi:hypothetical protein